MAKVERVHVAAATAFSRSRGRPLPPAGAAATARSRIHPAAIAFVAGFPALIGAGGLLGAFERTGTGDPAFTLAMAMFAVAGVLLVLGLLSFIRIDGDALTVRFYGLRSTTVRLSELESATFQMAFPSISFSIALTDRSGRRALVHANWWRDESAIVIPVCRALLEQDVAMDRETARLVAQLLDVPRPKPRVVHHGLFRKDRTW
jgi:hypothetical protein